MPEKPTQELVVALAGPAVNVVLAALLWPFVPAQDVADAAKALSPAQTLIGGLAEQLLWINVFLVAFNLLPAFPMDGGRVLRALLAMWLSRPRATQIAARVGQGMAVLFAIVAITGLPPMFGFGGLEPNLMLLLVAAFVWFGAGAEARAAQVFSGLTGVPVATLMRRDVLTVDPDDTLDAVLRYVRRGIQQDFPVVVSGQLVGLLSRTDLRYGLSRLGPTGRVFQASRREFPTLGPEDPAEKALALIAQGNPAVPVLYFGRLVGFLTAEDLSGYLWARRTEQLDRAADSRPPTVRSGA
jgi:CBS domain-containing protein